MALSDVSVFGLGKLGTSFSATLAEHGFSVMGVDIDSEVVRSIRNNEAPYDEPRLQEYIDGNTERLTATEDGTKAVFNSDVSFVMVDTPPTDNHRYSLEQVRSAVETIGEALGKKDQYHSVVITSTVFPGSTTGPIADWLESSSGKIAGTDFGLCYSPEFYALGKVIDGIEDPDFYLIGDETEQTGEILESIYSEINDSVPIVRMDPVSAEATKMALNSYVTMKISFVNTLSEICQGISADVDSVLEALTKDFRINGEYFSPGSMYGGPCFPRDNPAFEELAREAGTEAPLADATETVNRIHGQWIADYLSEVTPPGGSVAVLGLAFKPGTTIVEESQGIKLLEELPDSFSCYAHDPEPKTLDRARNRTGSSVDYCSSLAEALENADTAVITIPASIYSQAKTFSDYSSTLVDPWCLFEFGELSSVERYLPVGRTPTT